MPLGGFRLNSLGKSSAEAGIPFETFADPLAQYLTLALPFNSATGLDDVSHLVTGSSNTVPTSRTGPNNETYSNIQTSTSKFYGSAYRAYPGGGGTTKPVYALQNAFFPQSSFWTFEFWINTTRTNNNSWFLSNADVGGRFLLGIYVSGTPPTNISLSDYRMLTGTGWHHIAIQRDYWWYDGARRGTVAEPSLSIALANLHLGQFNNGDSNDWEGYLNDFRLYVGVQKYSGTTISVPGAIGQII